jgi:hypothetical protein
MIRTILAIAMAGFVSVPAFAMDDMSCADYTAMDSDRQIQAISTMEEGMMASGGMMASTDASEAMTPEDTAKAVAAACAENPEMWVGDALSMMQE